MEFSIHTFPLERASQACTAQFFLLVGWRNSVDDPGMLKLLSLFVCSNPGVAVSFQALCHPSLSDRQGMLKWE